MCFCWGGMLGMPLCNAWKTVLRVFSVVAFCAALNGGGAVVSYG